MEINRANSIEYDSQNTTELKLVNQVQRSTPKRAGTQSVRKKIAIKERLRSAWRPSIRKKGSFWLSQSVPADVINQFQDSRRTRKQLYELFKKYAKEKVLMTVHFVYGMKNESQRLKTKRLFQKQRTSVLPFYPDDTFMQLWRILYRLVLLIAAIAYPIFIAFYDLLDKRWIILLAFIEFIQGLSIILKFLTAFVDKNSRLQTKWSVIIRNYAYGWFLCDLILFTPTEQTSDHKFSSLPKVLFVIKYFLDRQDKDFYNIDKKKKLREESFKRGSTYKERFQTLLQFAVIFSDVVILTHVFSCTWYFAAELDRPSKRDWITSKYSDADFQTLYLTTIYWATETITVVGYGDIVGSTFTEYLVTVVWMWFGVGCYSFTIGNIAALLNMYDSKVEFENQMFQIEKLANITNLPDQLRVEIEGFFLLNIQDNPFWGEKSQLAYKALPLNLRRYMAVAALYDLFLKVNFLQQDIDFIEQIATSLVIFKVKKGTHIYRCGQRSNEIYFLVEGDVRITMQNKISLLNVAPGALFGEQEVVEERVRCSYSYAFKDSVVLVCPSKIFLQKLRTKPSLYRYFEEYYNRRRILINHITQIKKRQALQLKRSNNFIFKSRIFSKKKMTESSQSALFKTMQEHSLELLSQIIGRRLERRKQIIKRFQKIVKKMIRMADILGPQFLFQLASESVRSQLMASIRSRHRQAFTSCHSSRSRISKEDAISKLLDKHYVERFIKLRIIKIRKCKIKRNGFRFLNQEPVPFYQRKISITQSKGSSYAQIFRERILANLKLKKKIVQENSLVDKFRAVSSDLNNLSRVSTQLSISLFSIFELKSQIDKIIGEIKLELDNHRFPNELLSTLDETRES